MRLPKSRANHRNKNHSSLAKLFDHYLTYYASDSSHTSRAKRLDVKRFLDFLRCSRGSSSVEKLGVREFSYSNTQRFVEDCLASGESPATVSRRLATLKHMGRVLAENIANFVNPAREVKAPKIRIQKPQALARKEIVLARKVAKKRQSEKNSFIRLRNAVLFEFLLDTGLRVDEVRLLRLGQFDEKNEWIKNVRTKGKRFRNVYITSEFRPRLVQYLTAREIELKRFFKKLSKSQTKSLPLFISSYGADPLTPSSFMMGLKSIWRAVNDFSVDKSLHPHLLRHSFAAELLQHSKDVRLVSQALGHSDVKITMRYTERRDEEVAQALEKTRRSSRKVEPNS